MRTVPASTYVTEVEFLALPETMQRIELMDGEVVMAAAPTKRHQKLIGRLHASLHAWGQQHPPAWVGLSPLDIRFGPDRILQPDLCLFLQEPPDGPLITATPDLVIEVLSYNRSYDRMTKRMVYAEAGVAEYWIVDADRQLVELSTSLASMVVVKDRVTSSVAVGWSLELADLWRD